MNPRLTTEYAQLKKKAKHAGLKMRYFNRHRGIVEVTQPNGAVVVVSRYIGQIEREIDNFSSPAPEAADEVRD